MLTGRADDGRAMARPAADPDPAPGGVPMPARALLLFLGAIAVGSIVGVASPDTGAVLAGGVDPTVLLLVTVLFVDVDLSGLRLRRLREAPRFLAVAWLANFVLMPLLGFAIASLFLSGAPLLFAGVVIYFTAPCTDWFLGFTRLAGGNTSLGAVLLPVNMVTQLLLYPFLLSALVHTDAVQDPVAIGETLLRWCVTPALIAVLVRVVLSRALPTTVRERVRGLPGRLVPLIIAALIVQIFAANIVTIRDHADAFLALLGAVVLFFAIGYVLIDRLSNALRLEHPERALLAMTTAARNAPLMLGLTTVVLPDQPLIAAAIVIGMLIEFPHLAGITWLLTRRPRASSRGPAGATRDAGHPAACAESPAPAP
ncbi:arsenic resistance protein [Clavibacter sp. Sh2088]|uniref:arsenic resistance protein n=1 Tax=Clavibacter sp. Sh2088 TaxID=3397676 RepID=UPI0039E01776